MSKEEALQNDSPSSFDHNNNAPISQGVVLIYPSIIMVFFSGSLMASGFGNSDSKVCLGDKDLEFDVFRHLLHQRGQSLIQLELLCVTQRLFPYRGGIVGGPDIL